MQVSTQELAQCYNVAVPPGIVLALLSGLVATLGLCHLFGVWFKEVI